MRPTLLQRISLTFWWRRFLFALTASLLLLFSKDVFLKKLHAQATLADTKIAFTGGADLADIYVMNADGTNPVRLTHQPFVDFSPAWSPDGKQIAYQSGDAEIYVMNTDGTNQVNLTNNPFTDDFPSWSPNGTQIAFSERFDIYTMNADGTNMVNLTEGLRDGYLPSWSPVLSTVVSVPPKEKRIVQWGKVKDTEDRIEAN